MKPTKLDNFFSDLAKEKSENEKIRTAELNKQQIADRDRQKFLDDFTSTSILPVMNIIKRSAETAGHKFQETIIEHPKGIEKKYSVTVDGLIVSIDFTTVGANVILRIHPYIDSKKGNFSHPYKIGNAITPEEMESDVTNGIIEIVSLNKK